MLKKAFIKKANQIRWFGCSWVTCGRSSVSDESLDANCREIESRASIDGLIQFFTENLEELKNTYYEVIEINSFDSLFNFVVYEYGSYLSGFNDGGNVTYTLSYR